MKELLIYSAGVITLPVLGFLALGIFTWIEDRNVRRAADRDIAAARERMAARGHLSL
jgi:hypothetical protein